DHEGPFIMEGSHRYDALKILGAKEIPAVVALDLDDLKSESKPSVEEPNISQIANPERDTKAFAKARAEHPEWSLSQQLQEAAKRVNPTPTTGAAAKTSKK